MQPHLIRYVQGGGDILHPLRASSELEVAQLVVSVSAAL